MRKEPRLALPPPTRRARQSSRPASTSINQSVSALRILQSIWFFGIGYVGYHSIAPAVRYLNSAFQILIILEAKGLLARPRFEVLQRPCAGLQRVGQHWPNPRFVRLVFRLRKKRSPKCSLTVDTQGKCFQFFKSGQLTAGGVFQRELSSRQLFAQKCCGIAYGA
jgi:hypothetical protein